MPETIAALQLMKSQGSDLVIISDANTFYIDTILKVKCVRRVLKRKGPTCPLRLCKLNPRPIFIFLFQYRHMESTICFPRLLPTLLILTNKAAFASHDFTDWINHLTAALVPVLPTSAKVKSFKN